MERDIDLWSGIYSDRAKHRQTDRSSWGLPPRQLLLLKVEPDGAAIRTAGPQRLPLDPPPATITVIGAEITGRTGDHRRKAGGTKQLAEAFLYRQGP